MRKVIKATPDKIKQLLDRSINGVKTFTYFNKRPLEIVNDHLVSLILLEDDLPIAYFHLEEENNKVWLGMLIADDYIKKGIGWKCTKVLLDFATLLDVGQIYATTDKNGAMFQHMLNSKRFNYSVVEEINNKVVVSMNLKNGVLNG